MRALYPAVAAVCLLTGCYTFTAVPVEDVRPGLEVRVFLSPEGRQRTDALVGVSSSVLEGLVLESESDRLVLSRRWRDPSLEHRTDGTRQWVPVERPDILLVQVKEIQAGRTALLVGAAGVGMGYLMWTVLTGERRSGGGGPGTEEPTFWRGPAPDRAP